MFLLSFSSNLFTKEMKIWWIRDNKPFRGSNEFQSPTLLGSQKRTRKRISRRFFFFASLRRLINFFISLRVPSEDHLKFGERGKGGMISGKGVGKVCL
jgi:hypothetical protein